MPTTELSEGRLRQMYDDFANGRIDRVADEFDEDILFISHAPRDFFPYLGRLRGRKAVAQAFSELHEKLQLLIFHPLTILVDGDSAALTILMQVKDRASGQSGSFIAAHFLRFRNDKIADYRGIFDSLDAVQQLTGPA